jgi:hypothetical protein
LEALRFVILTGLLIVVSFKWFEPDWTGTLANMSTVLVWAFGVDVTTELVYQVTLRRPAGLAARVAEVGGDQAEESVVGEPVVDEPVVDEPVVDEAVVDEAVVDEPVVDEPVVDEPVVDEPVVDEPAEEEPLAQDEPIDDPDPIPGR